MSRPDEELLEIADCLQQMADRSKETAIQEPLEALKDAANTVRRAFSGSWLGYHAYVYYEGLQVPPPGAHFSQEWGLMDVYGTSLGSHGDWREYDPETVEKAVHEMAGNPDLDPTYKFAGEIDKEFEHKKSEVLSIITTELGSSHDAFLESLKSEIEELSLLSKFDVARQWTPSRQIMTRDTTALGQGYKTPPHITVLAEVMALQHSMGVVSNLSSHARKAGSHLLRKHRQRRRSDIVGTNVFIGHGRSPAWRELKDFIQERLGLPSDEFNRVPVAGITNIQRLSEMLDSAAIAFLVMTGEDEQKDGKLHARMNVVHEAGLFQGRLGFTRAIVVLEDECEEFSNIEGLGQIRFPKGNIKAAFEEIRWVLEREEIVPSA